MLLRASGEAPEGPRIDLRAVSAGNAHDSGVPNGARLIAFAEAVVERDPEAIARARAALAEAVGPAGVIDAAAVVGNFERMNRVADAIGLPLDPPMHAVSADIQDDLGLRRFASAEHTPELARWQRGLGALLRKALVPMMTLMRGGKGSA